jgi:hypothetical protein
LLCTRAPVCVYFQISLAEFAVMKITVKIFPMRALHRESKLTIDHPELYRATVLINQQHPYP